MLGGSPSAAQPVVRGASTLPAPVTANPIKLSFESFPVGFADYYCIQGTEPATSPAPRPGFARSSEPLLIHNPGGRFASAMLFDQSAGTGAYDTLYVDFDGDGAFEDDPVHKARPYMGRAPDLAKALAYFPDVVLKRTGPAGQAVHVQVFLKDYPYDRKPGERPYAAVIIPGRWARGQVEIDGRTLPVALVDRNWNDSCIDAGGVSLEDPWNTFPNGDYLIIGLEPDQPLTPGASPDRLMRMDNEGASPKLILTRHLQVGSDIRQVRARQTADGVLLELAPADVPVGTLRLKPGDEPMRLLGTHTAILLPTVPEAVAVSADIYSIFGNTGTASQTKDLFELQAGRTAWYPAWLEGRQQAQRAPRKPVAGEAAPPLRIRTVDGRPLDLADYRGKVVLLDFWATWCGPCIAEVPKLEALHRRFGGDSRFAMVSVSTDRDLKPLREYLAEKKLPWAQGVLEETNRRDVIDRYAVIYIPSKFLIGPDGRIIATDLRGENLEQGVAEALGGQDVSGSADVAPTATRPVTTRPMEAPAL